MAGDRLYVWNLWRNECLDYLHQSVCCIGKYLDIQLALFSVVFIQVCSNRSLRFLNLIELAR